MRSVNATKSDREIAASAESATARTAAWSSGWSWASKVGGTARARARDSNVIVRMGMGSGVRGGPAGTGGRVRG